MRVGFTLEEKRERKGRKKGTQVNVFASVSGSQRQPRSVGDVRGTLMLIALKEEDERKRSSVYIHKQASVFHGVSQPLAARYEEAWFACGMASDIHQMRIKEDGREFSANLTSTEYNNEICKASVTLASVHAGSEGEPGMETNEDFGCLLVSRKRRRRQKIEGRDQGSP